MEWLLPTHKGGETAAFAAGASQKPRFALNDIHKTAPGCFMKRVPVIFFHVVKLLP